MQTLWRIPLDIYISLIKERAMNHVMLKELMTEGTPYTYTVRSSQPLTQAQINWIRDQLEFVPSEKGWPMEDVPEMMMFE